MAGVFLNSKNEHKTFPDVWDMMFPLSL